MEEARPPQRRRSGVLATLRRRDSRLPGELPPLPAEFLPEPHEPETQGVTRETTSHARNVLSLHELVPDTPP